MVRRDLSPDAAREHVESSGGTRGVCGRFRRRVRVPAAVSGRSDASCTARHRPRGTCRQRLRLHRAAATAKIEYIRIMNVRQLGRGGPVVSVMGLGCMGMSEFYGEHVEAESIATIHRALDLGINFFDTADAYGPFANERLVGRAIRDRRSDVVLATKFGNVRGEDGSSLGISGLPEYVRRACDASLQRLGINTIDVYYQHRVDATVPIEETVGAMAELKKAGKIRFL